ncbi:MAG: hypothetical protein Q8Q59_13350 [Luteolibacter sp.]|jgi:hypothetical protein|nr:hypothetical protein [Luteolibacter sp.]
MYDPEPDPSRENRNTRNRPSLLATQNAGFKAFLHITANVLPVPEDCRGVDRKENQYGYCEKLLECLEATKSLRDQSDELTQIIDGLEFIRGGDEHLIHEGAGTVVKLTYGNNFGMKLNVYPEMPGYLDATVIPTGNEDHRYYLRRWMLLNEIFLPITTFRGMAPPQDEQGERLPRLSISQPLLDPENPPATRIAKSFREIGFIHISENAYYRPMDNVLLGDAAPRNVRFVDELILPFDAVAEQPEGEIQKLCILKAEKYG